MYALVQIGSHQVQVEPGKTITVEKLTGSEGSEVQFHDLVLYTDGTQVKTGKSLKGTVHGKITRQVQGPKIIAFKKKRRKGYKKTIGHRQQYTQVEITKIEA